MKWMFYREANNITIEERLHIATSALLRIIEYDGEDFEDDYFGMKEIAQEAFNKIINK
ncbi:hypothetical protein [Paenibacillus medicaginis]|uniref:Uncharacterized protein n=1 Tax=Paenibacillus medicaginis TaxID=1470560 RepID=A0ABV5BX99_9BACL